MPTHFIQNDSYRPVCGELEPVIRTIRFFEQKYGVVIHNKDSIINIITITEVEQIGNRLIKVFRPCIFYTDLNSKYSSVIQYYQSRERENWGADMDEGIKYDKVHAIKSSLERGEYIKENEVKLSELYAQYFRTRLYTFIGISPELEIVPEFPENENHWVRGELFHKCKDKEYKFNTTVLFREDDLMLYSYMPDSFVEMAQSRERLLEKMPGQEPEPKYYAVCANHISFEQLLAENPHVYRYSGDLPQIYSIIDSENIYQNNQNNREKFKSIYNILNRRDGHTLMKTLQQLK